MLSCLMGQVGGEFNSLMELGDLCGSLLTKASRIQWMGTGRALTIYRRCHNHEGYAKKSDLEIIIREHWLHVKMPRKFIQHMAYHAVSCQR